ncbi:MAG TPA: energy transducer TonB [Pyrinomonadaceae bacterium]|nr:energy transducer TonB [Pyrinomonadaceae bacterium]
MKFCPTCQRIYEDDAQRFCLEDGTPLVGAGEAAQDPGATIKIPAARLTSDAPTEVMSEDQFAPARAAAPRAAEPAPNQAPLKTPARNYEPPAGTAPAARKSSAAPWILGAAVVLGLSAIAVAVIMTRGGADNSQVAQTNQNVNASPTPAEVGPELIPRGGNPADGETATASPTKTGGGIGSGSGTGLDSKTPERPTPSPSRTPTERPTPTPKVSDDPPPKAPPPPRPDRPISGGVLNGKAISLPRPTYPAIARAARASGTVTVQVTIDESGKVISARAVGGHPLLQQSAVQAAYGARFSPTQLSGQPVKVTGVLTYNFVAP